MENVSRLSVFCSRHYPHLCSGGGSYIGKQLAKAFDIDLYDRKLLRLASEDSGISEELFARADENTRKTMLYRVSERVYDAVSSRRKAATYQR